MRVLAATLLFALLALAGPRSGAAQTQPPFELNVLLSLTGGAAFLGHAVQQSLQLEEGVINAHGGLRGRPVKFTYLDDESNPQVGVQLVNGLVAKKTNVFLGSPLAAVCQAVLPIVGTSGPVNYCLSPPVHPPAGSFMFTTGASAVDLGEVMLHYLRARNLTRIAMITTTDATGHDVDEAFNELFSRPENKPFQVVTFEHFNPADISVSAQVARIKAGNPQAIFAWTVGTASGTLFRALHDAGVDVPVAESNSNQLFTALTQFAGTLPRELMFPSYRAMTEGAAADNTAVRNAQSAMFAALKSANVQADIGNVTAWDPVMLVVDALRRNGPNATPAQIRSFIASQKRWAGVNGVYDYTTGNQRGLNPSQLVVDRYDQTKKSFTVISKPGGEPL